MGRPIGSCLLLVGADIRPNGADSVMTHKRRARVLIAAAQDRAKGAEPAPEGKLSALARSGWSILVTGHLHSRHGIFCACGRRAHVMNVELDIE